MAKEKNIPVDIYHRIYRMGVRNIPVGQIAYTLELPIKVVKNIVAQLFPIFKGLSNNKKEKPPKIHNSVKQSYLDIYILQRLRFSIFDLYGMITDTHLNGLQEEFKRMLNSNSKIIAIRMSNVKAINETGLSIILSFKKDFSTKGRYTAILDPSKEIESFIIEKEVEKEIHIFGTEKAFEEYALKIKEQKELP